MRELHDHLTRFTLEHFEVVTYPSTYKSRAAKLVGEKSEIFYINKISKLKRYVWSFLSVQNSTYMLQNIHYWRNNNIFWLFRQPPIWNQGLRYFKCMYIFSSSGSIIGLYRPVFFRGSIEPKMDEEFFGFVTIFFQSFHLRSFNPWPP